ncbi:DNA repair helicase [Tilletiaria anomala UBC 951]|uniref:ATP-dependent DNA helicase CHL1 n=1 Tax=Tilletiaria anomala (strain ATCC 24038 / CBS 436.72 / UBC 951) TaxID=1037660 RepID=A0A066VVJ1_TILAU|nr:DNA repair helicase [Tilletiaria anomala UBC 951]KDN45742.1 DNA repair helicase [Tilletiaria anomala UBC 951]
MQAVFRAIEDAKVGIFESPTGTGKSLSLICSAFTWLEHNAKRSELANESEPSHSGAEAGTGDEPDWVLAHARAKQREKSEMAERELKQRIAHAKRLQAKFKKERRQDERMNRGNSLGRKKTSYSRADSDEEFLLDSGDEASSPTSKARKNATDELGLSAEVRALMAQYDQSSAARASSFNHYSSSSSSNTLNRTTPKTYYASRTHSQLSQFVHDNGLVAQTEVTEGDAAQSPVRVVALGSRKQMCINEAVQQIGRERGTEAMNERCKELLKGKRSTAPKNSGGQQVPQRQKNEKRCPYAPAIDEGGLEQAMEFRDHAFTEVRDIEDLTELGRSLNTCPYFASRLAAKQAQLVTLPYNLLLHADSRLAAGVDVTDNVILIDEAHNLIDTILATHTVSITLTQIQQAQKQIETYVNRFALKLRGSNEMHLKQLELALKSLSKHCLRWVTAHAESKSTEEIVTASQLVSSMDGTLDQINLAQLDSFLRDSQIARKVAGYADKQAIQAANSRSGGSLENRNSITSMRTISSFLLSLINADQDGKVLLSMLPQNISKERPLANAGADASAAPNMIIKYQLLNPSKSFKTLVDQSRAIILAGGTMEPVSDLLMQVLPHVPPTQISRLSCGHIIPSSNLFAAVVSVGPKKARLEFKFDSRNDHALLDELGSALSNFCNVIPDGMVVFVPSYKVLNTFMERWKATKQLDSLMRRKKLFIEPQTAAEVDAVLRHYTSAIEMPQPGMTGAILIAVVGAKLSEGINFSDRLARAVVMVGLPFPNAASAELVERMRFARELASKQQQGSAVSTPKVDAGKELYVNMCMKAVNQSIGRAIRHRNDYAALLLVDMRFARQDISSKLPGWIRSEVHRDLTFPLVMRDLAGFFRSKRTTPNTGL